MKHYFAQFKKTKDAIEVEFPDLKGCVTFGKNWDEAYTNAIDVLAAWFAHADPEFIQKPSKHDDLKGLRGDLVPVPYDEKIRKSYEELKRFNVIFPAKSLQQIDAYRKREGLKRSAFLLRACEAYLKNKKQRAG